MKRNVSKEGFEPTKAATLVDLFFWRAHLDPDRTFCRFLSSGSTWSRMSFKTIGEKVTSLAAGLRHLGLNRGEGLALLAKTRWEWFALEMAALRIGGFVTGLEPHGSTDDLVFRINHSGVRGLAMEASEINRLPATALKNLRFIIFLDSHSASPSDGAVGITFEELQDRGSKTGFSVFPFPNPEDFAALLYTSGTTGVPKAIRYRHRHVMAAVRSIEKSLPTLGTRDSVLCWLPLSHLFQRMINYIALSTGATMAFLSDPRDIVTAAHKIRPTVFLGVPRFYEKFVQKLEEGMASLPPWLRETAHPREQTKPMSPLKRGIKKIVHRFLLYPRLRRVLGGRIRMMMTGSAPISTDLLALFHRVGLPLYEAYGVSENTLPIAMNIPNRVLLGSVGQPLTDNTVRISEEGEVCVKGPGVCEAYWKSAVSLPLDKDGYYQTGDLGRWDAEGFLHLLGRRDDLFKTSTGRKIMPTQLETVYGASPLFERVMAVGRGKPFPALLIWLKSNTVLDRQQIIQEMDRLGAGLLPYERAGAFLTVPTPPTIENGTLTASLKLRRRAVEERVQSQIDALYEERSGSSPGSFPRTEPPRFRTTKENRPRVLLVPEGVALSHPARALQLARELDPEKYEIHFATDPRYWPILGPMPWYTHDIHSIPPERFDRTVARGGVVYTQDILEEYVREERALFDRVRPDVIVGEWRPSLGISARLAGVPYISILNAYWNPSAQVRHILPEYAFTEWMPRKLAQTLFDRMRPWGYAQHARPVNAVRESYGLPLLPPDFRAALIDGDWTLYPDLHYLFPTTPLSSNESYMAPISWSPQVALPAWWTRIPTDKPVVYANLGSSGRAGVLQRVLDALGSMPVTVIAATAGRQTGLVPPSNAFLAEFLPGQETAARSDILITNGGNMSAYQGLAEGKPLIGLASNVDQFLNMATVEDAGAGKLLRASTASAEEIKQAAHSLLNDSRAHLSAKCLGAELAISTLDVFVKTVDRAITKGAPRTR